MFSVFTPLYNRAHLIYRIFISLCNQTNKDFEWIIVDDGSTDKSEEVIAKLNKKTHNFRIRYIYQENGGKHRAINKGVREAEGELFMILDSDDSLPPTAIETI